MLHTNVSCRPKDFHFHSSKEILFANGTSKKGSRVFRRKTNARTSQFEKNENLIISTIHISSSSHEYYVYDYIRLSHACVLLWSCSFQKTWKGKENISTTRQKKYISSLSTSLELFLIWILRSSFLKLIPLMLLTFFFLLSSAGVAVVVVVCSQMRLRTSHAITWD